MHVVRIDFENFDPAGTQFLDLLCRRNRESMLQKRRSQPGTVELLDLHADFQLIDGYPFSPRNYSGGSG